MRTESVKVERALDRQDLERMEDNRRMNDMETAVNPEFARPTNVMTPEDTHEVWCRICNGPFYTARDHRACLAEGRRNKTRVLEVRKPQPVVHRMWIPPSRWPMRRAA